MCQNLVGIVIEPTQPAPELLIAPANRPRRLDYDTYKILTRALLS